MPAQVSQWAAGQMLVDPQFNQPSGGQSGTSSLAVKIFNATKDNFTMGSALTTWNAGYFTPARLAQMTSNDLLYTIMQNQAAIAAVLP